MSDDAPAAEPTPRELLAELWLLSVKAAIAELKTDKCSAASLNVARQMLSDSGVSLDTLPQLQRSRGSALPAGLTLPFFGDDADDTPPEAAPTHATLPFDTLEASDDPNR